MYNNTAAEIRQDLSAAVEEAMQADKFFLHEILVPTKFVRRNTGEFHKLTKGATGLMDANLGDSTLRAPKTAYKKVNRSYTKDGFLCLDRGLEEDIDDSQARAVAPSFDQEMLATRLCTRNVRIAQEARVAAMLQNPALFSATAASVAYTEANIATMDHAFDLQEAIAKVEKRGEGVTDIVYPRQVWNRIRRSTVLRKYLFGENGGGAMITLPQMSEAFDGIQFHVAKASYNAGKKGQEVNDASLSYIWNNTQIFVGSLVKDVGAGVLEEGEIATFQSGVAVNFVWELDASGLYVVESYRKEETRSDVVRVRQNNIEKIINAEAGTLITTQFG